MDLARLLERRSSLKGTPNDTAASRLYEVAFHAAHGYPRENKLIRSMFTKLRVLCIKEKVWEGLKRSA